MTSNLSRILTNRPVTQGSQSLDLVLAAHTRTLCRVPRSTSCDQHSFSFGSRPDTRSLLGRHLSNLKDIPGQRICRTKTSVRSLHWTSINRFAFGRSFANPPEQLLARQAHMLMQAYLQLVQNIFWLHDPGTIEAMYVQIFSHNDQWPVVTQEFSFSHVNKAHDVWTCPEHS